MTEIPKSVATQAMKANIANILRKVKSGKTLSSAELRILAASGEDPKPSDLVTTTRLAQMFGINRKTIAQWRKEGLDVPEKVDGQEPLQAWREWFACHPESGHGNAKPRADRETLLCEKLEVEIAIKRIELEVESGKVVEKAKVRESMAALGSVIKTMLKKIANDLPPRIEGMQAAQIKVELESEINRLIDRFHDGIA